MHKVNDTVRITNSILAGGQIVSFQLLPGMVDKFTLSLCLLAHQIVPGLEFNFGKTKLLLLVARKISAKERRRSYLTPGAKIEGADDERTLTLSLQVFEALLYLCLRTTRDGQAEVDHIDIEAIDEKARSIVDVTIEFPVSAPPRRMSPTEFLKELDEFERKDRPQKKQKKNGR